MERMEPHNSSQRPDGYYRLFGEVYLDTGTVPWFVWILALLALLLDVTVGVFALSFLLAFSLTLAREEDWA